jgi:hypothetical protein
MVNETIAYRSPEKTKSIMHYLNTDRETRISPVGVYSSLGQVDYFAFQRSTKTFKVDFFEELTREKKEANKVEVLNERGLFRSFGEKDDSGSSEYNGLENDWNSDDKSFSYDGNLKNNFFNSVENLNINFLDNRQEKIVKDSKGAENKEQDTKFIFKDEKKNINNNNISNNKLKKNSNNIIDLKSGLPNSKKTSEKSENLFTNSNKLTTQTQMQSGKSKKTLGSTTLSSKSSNSTEASSPISFLDFSLEYIYDAKHLIHSVSDFRSTPDFNNITYNYDRFIWNLINENYDKSDETVKIELFFDMEETFYSENIFVNLNFTKSIFLLNQTEKRAIENFYTKIDSNIMLENANYSYIDGAVYLMEKVMNSSPDLDRIQYYVKSKTKNHKNDLIKIMKVEAEKVLKFNETFQLEVKFPLYFENCRNYKTNSMIMITGIVLMVFMGSVIYLCVSLNFSDKE